jgi:hypothetical protein
MGQQSRNPFDDVMFSCVCVCARARVLMVSSRPLISFFPLRFFSFSVCECNGGINACYQSLYVCEVVVLKKNNNKAKKKPGPAREWLAKAGQGRTGLFNAEVVVLVVVEGEYHRQRYGSPPLFFLFL